MVDNFFFPGYLKLQDNLISGLIKAPCAISSTPNSIPVSSPCGKVGGGGGHPLPSWQHQRSCGNFIHRWLGNRLSTVHGSQAKCIWQSWPFELLYFDNMTPNEKNYDIRFDLLWFWTKQAYYQGGFWLSPLFHLICTCLVNILQIPVASVEQKQMLQQMNPKEKVWILVCWVLFFLILSILLSRNDKIGSQLGTQLFMTITQLTSLLLCHPKWLRNLEKNNCAEEKGSNGHFPGFFDLLSKNWNLPSGLDDNLSTQCVGVLWVTANMCTHF